MNRFATMLAHLTAAGMLVMSIVWSLKGSVEPDRLALLWAVQAVFWMLVALFHKLDVLKEKP